MKSHVETVFQLVRKKEDKYLLDIEGVIVILEADMVIENGYA